MFGVYCVFILMQLDMSTVDLVQSNKLGGLLIIVLCLIWLGRISISVIQALDWFEFFK